MLTQQNNVQPPAELPAAPQTATLTSETVPGVMVDIPVLKAYVKELSSKLTRAREILKNAEIIAGLRKPRKPAGRPRKT